MVEIKENQELNVKNVLSYRGKVKQTEVKNIGQDMEAKIQESGAKKEGNPISATYGVDGECLDIEIIIPIDKEIESIGDYVFKKRIHIVNAVVACYKGHPIGLQEACNSLNQYIINNRLQPITVGYNVTKKADISNPEDTEIDVYVGISPNIL